MSSRPLLLLWITSILALLPAGGVAVCPHDGSLALGAGLGCPCDRDQEGDADPHGTCEDVRSEGLRTRTPAPPSGLGTPGPDALPPAERTGPIRPAERPRRPPLQRRPPPRPPGSLRALGTVRLQL